MTGSSINNIRHQAVLELINSGIAKNEASIEANILVECVFGLSKKDMLINPKQKVPENLEKKFKELVQKRINEKIPVQYLVNKAFFMGYEFYVDENVLIPRPETEILVEEVIKLIKASKKKNLTIIDIGTGSGCIACMLAKNLYNKCHPEFISGSNNYNITASDISKKALDIAKFNAQKLNIADKIEFQRSDILKDIDETFNFIISNPPYIPLKDRESLQIEVSGHEPHLALFVDDEKGISFYKELIRQSKEKLNSAGYLAVEIGISQSHYISELLQEAGFVDIQIIKDFSDIDRVIIARK
ncbi:MAG: peptide chain release factor N(5)-glutamine methyltransferase [Candidatus Gastranaerophilales bacterium]|nr:peptide chain release factor N(5)-glutamine methyltransferase [Candidatus Gastranaerophilales bacterium]